MEAIHGFPNSLPNRLIELNGSRQHPQLRLVHSFASNSAYRYATLSYCWGGLKPLILREENLKAFTTAIPWPRLPQTFKDTVLLVASLGLRYLWIDALCIIQDDLADWSTEATRMMSVYANAVLNISADHGNDSEQGLFKLRDIERIRPLAWSYHGEVQSSHWILYDNYDFTPDVAKAPVNRRAWVVQERFLAARVVHFGATQMYWECAYLTATERLPASLDLEVPDFHTIKRLSDTAIEALKAEAGGPDIYAI